MACEWQIIRLSGLLAIKMIREPINFANLLAHQSTTSTNKRQQWWTQAEHSRRKSGPPFMRRLGIHKNNPVSGTRLTLGLRLGFISSHFTVDKLFPVNPREITGPPKMSLLLEAKSMPVFIIKPRLILVAHTVDLGWNKTYKKPQQSKPQQDCQQTKCYVRVDPALLHKSYSNWLDV